MSASGIDGLNMTGFAACCHTGCITSAVLGSTFVQAHRAVSIIRLSIRAVVLLNFIFSSFIRLFFPYIYIIQYNSQIPYIIFP